MESESNRAQFRDATKTELIHGLPKEIVEEILSRLPVKPLLICRCVSKSWRSLINSRRFIKTHLDFSTKNPNFAHHKIVFFNSSPPHHTLKHVSLHSLMCKQVTDTFAFDDSIYTQIDSLRLVGCCDGLICILIDRRNFFLWNPSTRMHKKLPYVDQELKDAKISKYGFGFDELRDDYKVFAVLPTYWVTGRNVFIGKIYSLKTDSWKVLKEKDADPYLESGEFVNGKIYWASKRKLKNEWGIVSFDLKNEVYGSIEHPNYRADKKLSSMGVLDGRLCVICDNRKTCADVWVMKEYGVKKELWEKLLSVPYPYGPWEGLFSIPFCVGSKGEMLFLYGSSFLIYYPENNTYWRPVMTNFRPYGEADVFVESLVSLVRDDEREREI